MEISQISRSIKEKKWLAIEYQNARNEETRYWIAITGIDIEQRKLRCDMYNSSKMNEIDDGVIKDSWIFFDKIKNARIIPNTSYNQPDELIPFLRSSRNQPSWLPFDGYHSGTIEYIEQCLVLEQIPYQRETTLIKGIDQQILTETTMPKGYQLSHLQIAQLVSSLESLSKREEKQKYEIFEMALNVLAISTDRGLFLIAYREVTFNPSQKSLIVGTETKFNYEFASEANEMKMFKHNLRHYLDIETDKFVEIFLNDPDTAKDMLQAVLPKGKESLDDRPYFIDVVRRYNAHVGREMFALKEKHAMDAFTVPLNAFFGNMSKDMLKRKRTVNTVLLDSNVDIDQLRVIYNALVQPITYVQGPPGTGKTTTIINVLISALFNEQKVMVSSNNNKPISDIYERIMSLHVHGSSSPTIPLPIIRIGNEEKVNEGLNDLRERLRKYSNYPIQEDMLTHNEKRSREELKHINLLLEQYEKRQELEEDLDVYRSLKTRVKASSLHGNVIIDAQIADTEQELSRLPVIRDEHIIKLIPKIEQGLYNWLYYSSIKRIIHLKEPKYDELRNIIEADDSEERVSSFNNYTQDSAKLHDFQRLFPIILTTNQSAHRLGKQEPSFDLIIIDEAGQCAIGPSLYAIARGERLLLVGDQNQLRPVLSLPPETNAVLMRKYEIAQSYDYVENSILLTMKSLDTISKSVLLSHHYRSDPRIIGFSNKKYYHGQLKMVTQAHPNQEALQWIDTQNQSGSHERNTALTEIQAIITDIKKNNYSPNEVGIITPFHNQAELTKQLLQDEKLSSIESGTIHTFQGGEKRIIYFSSAITPKSSDKTFDWIKNHQELINVGTTRAKEKFILVGDFKEIDRRSKLKNDFKELSEYVRNRGDEVVVTLKEQPAYVNGANYRQYNTKKEQEFLDTIEHIISLETKHIVEHKVRVASILNRFTEPKLYDYGLKAEFDLVIFSVIGKEKFPVLAVEIDGEEHKNNIEVIKRDGLKEKICSDNGIKIIHIQNDYSRRYIFIKEILEKLLND